MFGLSPAPIVFHFPVLYLAILYIGPDAYKLITEGMTGYINIVAHVFGGLAGYLLGPLWFKQRRADIKEELDDEIEDAKYRRIDPTGINSSHPRATKRLKQEREFKRGREAHQKKLDQLYKAVSVHNSPYAIQLLLEEYDEFHKSPEIYEEIYQHLRHWPNGRTLYCCGRLLCNLYIEKGKTSAALRIAEECIEVAEQFVLSSYHEMIILVQEAIRFQQYPLAYALIRNAPERYPEAEDDSLETLLLEAEIQMVGLGNRKAALGCFQQLQQQQHRFTPEEKRRIMAQYQSVMR